MTTSTTSLIAALAETPENHELVEELETAWLNEEAWSALVEELPGHARNLRDSWQKMRYLLRAAVVALGPASNPAAAKALLEEIVTIDLPGREVGSAIHAMYARQSAWAELAGAALQLSSALEEGPYASALLHVAGRTYEDRLHDPKLALRCYQQAFKAEPMNREPLRDARALYARSDQWGTVAKLYRIELKLESEARTRARLLKELGHVEIERNNNREGGIEALREALELDPDLAAIREVLTNLGVQDDAHAPEHAAPAAQAEVPVPVEPVDEPVDESAADSGEEAAEPEPEAEEIAVSADAEEEVEEAASAEEDAEEAASAEEDAEEAASAEEDASAEAEGAPEVEEDVSAEEAAEEVASAEAEDDADEDLAAEAEHVDEEDEVVSADAAAEADESTEDAALAETDDEVSSEAVEAEEVDETPGVEAAAEEPVEAAAEEEAAAQSQGEAAASEEPPAPEAFSGPARPVDGDRARRAWAELGGLSADADATLVAARIGAGLALEEDPEELALDVAGWMAGRHDAIADVRVLLSAALGNRGFWASLLTALDAVDMEGELRAAASYAIRLSGLCAVDAAVAGAAAAGPLAQAEAESLEFAQKGNWRKVQQILVAALEGAHGDAAEAESYRSQAAIALALEKEDKAADALRRLSRKAKGDMGAIVLSRAVNERQEKWNAYADALKHEVELIDEAYPGVRAWRLAEMLRVYRDELNQDLMVIQASQSLLDVEPHNLALVEELCALLERLNRFPDMVDLLRRKADMVSGDPARIAVLEELAALLTDRFSNQMEAIRTFEAILEIDADHRASLEQLEDLYEKRREFEKLIEVKRRLVQGDEESAAAVARLQGAADIAATRLRDTALAVELWRESLALDPGNAAALEALEQLHERDKDWEALASVLEERVQVTEDPEALAGLWQKLGQTLADRLDESARAAEAYEALLDLDPENLRARESLKKAYVELEDWDRMEALYARLGAWDEYVRQLEATASRSDDDATAIDLYFRSARAWREQLEQPERAVRSLEQILKLDDTNIEAARALQPFYEERGDARRQAPLLELIVAHTADAAERHDLMVRLARLLRDSLRDAEGALPWFSRALIERPSSSEILDELLQLARELGTPEVASEALVQAREGVSGDDAELPTWLRYSDSLGLLLEQELGDADGALAVFDDVLLRAPAHRPALDARIRILEAMERWDDLLAAFEARLQTEEDAVARREELERIAALHQERRGDVVSAIEVWESLLAEQPEHWAALRALRALHGETGDALALDDVLGRLMSAPEIQEDPAALASLHIERAQLRLGELADANAALEQARAAVALDPESEALRSLLETLVDEGEVRAGAASILLPLAEAAGDWARVVELLELLVELSASDEERTALLERIAAVHRAQADGASASDAYARLLRSDPMNEEASSELEALAMGAGTVVEVVALYEALGEELATGDEIRHLRGIELLQRAAAFADAQLEDVDEAIRLRRRVLDVDPENAESLEALDDLLQRAERWEELIGILGERRRRSEGVDARTFLVRSATVAEERLDDPLLAIESYREILVLEPADAAALEELDRLYGAVGDAAAQAEILEARLQLLEASGEDVIGLKFRLAQLLEAELADAERAIATWADILRSDPGHTPSLEALEGLLENPDLARSASAVLEPLYAEGERWQRLANVLLVQMEHVSSPEERRDMYRRVATLQQTRMEDPAGAADTLLRACAEQVEDDALLDALVALAVGAQQGDALAQRFETFAEEHADFLRARALLERAARIYRDEQGDAAAASIVWQRVLANDEMDLRALEHLETLYVELSESEALIDILSRLAAHPDVAGDMPRRHKLLFRVAGLQETALEDRDAAVDVLRTVLTEEPSDEGAMAELERLLEAEGRWEELVELLEHKRMQTQDEVAQGELYRQMGEILRRRMEEPERAIDAYRALLQIRPDDQGALDALSAALHEIEDWPALYEITIQRARAAAEPVDGLPHLLEAGRILESQMDDSAGAVAIYQEALAIDSSWQPARTSLLELIARGEEVRAAAAVIEPLLREESAWDELLVVLGQRVEQEDLPDARRDLLAERAAILRDHREDPWAAFDELARAAQESLRADEVRALHALGTSLERWQDLVDVLDTLHAEALEPELRTEIGLRLAELLRTRLQDVERAIEVYGRVHEEDAANAGALVALEELHEERGDAEAVADVLQKRILLEGDAARANPLRLKLAAVYAEQLGEGGEALETYREILVHQPATEAAINGLQALAADPSQREECASILQPLFRDLERWDDLIALYRTMLRDEPAGEERYRMLLELADVLRAHRAENPDELLEVLAAAITEQPGDLGLREDVERLAESEGAWYPVIEAYRGVLASEDASDTERFELAVRLGHIFESRMDDAASAEESYRAALAIEGGDDRVLAPLDRILSAQDRHADLDGILALRREAIFEPAELVPLTLRHARLVRDALGEAERAVELFQEALELDPVNSEALRDLEALHEVMGEWEALLDILERRASLVADEGDRLGLLEKMARIASGPLARTDEAIDLWNRVLALEGRHEEALDSLQALYEAGEMHLELIDVLRRRLELAADDDQRVWLLERIAAVFTHELEDEAGAIGAWNQVLEIEPAHRGALSELRTLQERSGDLDGLARTLHALVGQAEEGGPEELELRIALARLYSDSLMQDEPAIAAWQRVRTLQPGHQEALERLDELLSRSEAHEALVDVLDARATHVEEPMDAVDHLRRAATLLQSTLQRPEPAARMWERLFELDMEDMESGHQLEQLYETLEEWENLVALHLDRLEVLDDEFERLTTLRKAATVYEHRLDQPEGAFLILQRAISEAPADEELRDELERLAAATDGWDELVQTYTETSNSLSEAGAEDETLPLQFAIGRIQHERLGRPEIAEIFFEKVLFLDPEHEASLRQLRTIYRETENWSALVDGVKKLANLSYDAEEQVALFTEAGALYEREIGDQDEAIEAYKMALRIDELHAPTMEALERIYEATGRWRELVEIMGNRADNTFEPADVVPIRFRIAEIWRDELDVPERAVDTLRELLTVDPTHRPSLTALEHLHAAMGRWEKYLDVLEEQRHLAADDVTEQCAILFRMASAHEVHFGDIDRAVDTLREILVLVPGSLEAIGELERVFLEQGRFDELVDTFELRVQHSEDPAAKVEALLQLAKTYASELEDAWRALDTYRRALEIAPDEPRVLDGMGRLAEELGNWQDALACYEKLGTLLSEPAERLTLLQRVGELRELELGEIDVAEGIYNQALELEPSFLPAMQALQRVHMGRGAWQDAIAMIQRQVEYTRELTDRATLLVHIGAVYESHLAQPDQARQMYEEAIQLDPGNVNAAAPLAEMYLTIERWEKARPLLQLLLDRTDDETADEELIVLNASLGRAHEELGDHPEAIQRYEAVLRLDSSHLDSLLGLARLYGELDATEDAYRIYLELLALHRDNMEPAQLVETLYRAGSIQVGAGDTVTASDHFEGALAIDPGHEPSLRALLPIVDEVRDVATRVQVREQLLAVVSDELESFQLRVDCGDLQAEAGMDAEAERAYRDAVRINPQSKVVLHKLLNIYTGSEQWQKAVEVLGLLASVEQDGGRRAKLLMTIASISREYIGDTETALKMYNEALDADLSSLDAFQAIDELLTSERDWQALERNYRRMVERVRTNANPAQYSALEFQLYRGLGEIYRSRLMDLEKAIHAFRLASEVDPENEMMHQILAELYEKTGHTGPEVVREHQRLIQLSPFRIESYRALFNAYIQTRQFDEAWCMAAALRLLQKATAEENQYYEKYLPAEVVRPKRPMTSEHWGLCTSSEVDVHLSAIFKIVIEHLRGQVAQKHKALGLHRSRDLLSPKDRTLLSVQLDDNLRVQGVAPPKVYTKSTVSGLYPVNLPEPSLLAGHNVLSGQQPRPLAFEVARAVALLRPEFALGALFQTSELKIFLYAALALFSIPTPPDVAEEYVVAYARELQNLPAPVRNQLQQVVQALIASGQSPNISTWLRGVDFTVNRVGMLLCGDLRHAVNAVKDSPGQIGKADLKERVRDLTLFSISEEYFRLRRDLGLGLQSK